MKQPSFVSASKNRLMSAPRLRQVLSAAMILGAAVAFIGADPRMMTESLSLLLMLMAVLVNAACFGFWTGILSAIGAFVLLNYLFIEPTLSLHATRPQDVFMLFAFLAAGALTGFLAGRLREQLDAARGRARALEVLVESSGALGAASSVDEILDIALRQISRLAPLPVIVIARDDFRIIASCPDNVEPTTEDVQAAARAFTYGRTEYATYDGWNASRMNFHPLPFGQRDAGFAIGHMLPEGDAYDADERERAIAVILQQTSSAMERNALGVKAHDERIARERQTLRTALLASLSHDLRTPLATILGAATTLRELEHNLSPEAKADLLTAVAEESQRLADYVEKLLQMTRLIAGVALNLSPVDPRDTVMAAITRAKRAWPNAMITAQLPDLPLVRADAVLLEQMVFNLIENALRYAHGTVTVSGRMAEGRLCIAVSDTGAGLPDSVANWLLSDDLMPAVNGGGLGLPICKGIAKALGGMLIYTPDGSGARLVFALPLHEQEAS